MCVCVLLRSIDIEPGASFPADGGASAGEFLFHGRAVEPRHAVGLGTNHGTNQVGGAELRNPPRLLGLIRQDIRSLLVNLR